MSLPEERAGPAERGWATRRVLIALALATLVIYGRLIGVPFLQWDDGLMVVQNADLLPSHWPAIVGYWRPTHPHIGLYAPLTYSVYAALAAIGVAAHGSLTAVPFRVMNVAVHLAAGWPLWSILRRRASPRAATFGVAIFWLHPVQVEAVAWIASLNTLLAGALVIAALATYARAVATGRRATFAASCAIALLASFAKPSAVAAPLAAFAMDRWWLGSRWRDAGRRSLAWAILMVPAIVAGRLAQPASASDVLPGLFGRAWIACDTLGFYVAHVVAPIELAMDYGRVPAWVLGLPPSSVAYVGLAVGVAIAVGLMMRRGRAIGAAAAGVFFAGIAPVLGLASFDFQHFTTVADRYLYWSMAGVAIAVSMATDRWRVVRRVAPIAIVALAIASFNAVPNWYSDEALFDRALAVNPASRKALYVKAYVAVQAAGRARDEREKLACYAEPIGRYEEAIKLRPGDGYLHLGAANLYLQAGALDVACRHFEAAATSDARLNAEVWRNWGIASLRRGDPGAAARFERALALDPNDAQSRDLLNDARRAAAATTTTRP